MIAPRRAFLRGLATLPLIGGGVEILGNPVAVAEPVTDQLMFEYMEWLGWERHKVVAQFCQLEPHQEQFSRSLRTYSVVGNAYDWHWRDGGSLLPSTRAALVLGAVGVDWKAPYR